MQKTLVIGLAGLVGTLARYWLSGWIGRKFGETFPTGTLVVNLVGCFLVGFLYHSFEERHLVDPMIRSAVLIGLLGGFTTFSAYGIQTFTLLRDGEFALALLNVFISNFCGLLLVWTGYTLAKAV